MNYKKAIAWVSCFVMFIMPVFGQQAPNGLLFYINTTGSNVKNIVQTPGMDPWSTGTPEYRAGES